MPVKFQLHKQSKGGDNLLPSSFIKSGEIAVNLIIGKFGPKLVMVVKTIPQASNLIFFCNENKASWGPA